MPAQLVALTEGPNILLDKPILLIGRHPECDIQIDSSKVSRRHCCVAQVHDYLVVRDLGSTNGIRINGVRILEGRLKESDELTIAGFRYRVTWDLLAAPIPARAAPKRPQTERFAAPYAGDGLESCDEPIPLAEPDGPSRKAERPPAAVAPPHERPSGRHFAPPASDRPRTGIVPENINLAPPSDRDVPTARRPSS
jgi:predicted component of type VI protein secretion system